ncbi:MAG: MliC family protein [Burkholderiales bacterium]|nr:MliC family protein [Burkholderiales bacterium]
MNRIRWSACMALAVMLAGCAGGWWPWGGAGREQPVRLPEGAIEYACAEGKRLLVRYAADGKSAWVIYPDREFRLDRAGAGERFSNGATTLLLQGDEAMLDADGARQFAECKRKPS